MSFSSLIPEGVLISLKSTSLLECQNRLPGEVVLTGGYITASQRANSIPRYFLLFKQQKRLFCFTYL